MAPQERQNYSFSDSNKILKMTEQYAGTIDLSTFAYLREDSGKELSDAGELVVSGGRRTYSFAYLEGTPNFEVSQKGIQLKEYPWHEFEFAAWHIPLMWNY